MRNITICGSSEVYESAIAELTDTFIDTELNGKVENIAKQFPQLLYYIHDNMQVPSHDDAEGLDKLFDDYVRLCSKCGVLPTIEGYSMLTGIHRATFYDWCNGDYRRLTPQYSDMVKKWRSICKEHLLFELSNAEKPSINKIFIAKACYGIVETQMPSEEIRVSQVRDYGNLPMFRENGKE